MAATVSPQSAYASLASDAGGGLVMISRPDEQAFEKAKAAIASQVILPLQTVSKQVAGLAERLSFSSYGPAETVEWCRTELSSLEPVLHSHLNRLSMTLEADQIPHLMSLMADAFSTYRTLNRKIARIERFCNIDLYRIAVGLLQNVQSNFEKYTWTSAQYLAAHIVAFASEWEAFKKEFSELHENESRIRPDVHQTKAIKDAHHLRAEIAKVELQASGLFLSASAKLTTLCLAKGHGMDDAKAQIPGKVQGEVVQCITSLKQKLNSYELTRMKIALDRVVTLPSDQAVATLAAKTSALSGVYCLPAQGTWRQEPVWYDGSLSSPTAKSLELVVKAMLSLLKDITDKTKAVLSGDCIPTVGKKTLHDECNGYRDMCAALEKKLEDTLFEYHQKQPDSYVVTFSSWAAGLRETLSDIRRSLRYLYKFASNPHTVTVTALEAMRKYLSPHAQVFSEQGSRVLIENLFVAASGAQAGLQTLRSCQKQSAFEKDAVALLSMVNDTVVRKGPKALELVELEEHVWQKVTTLTDLETLETLQEREVRIQVEKKGVLQQLPSVVQSVIEKMIYAFLYQPKERGVVDDFSLELLLYILNKHPLYADLFRKSLNDNEKFREMIAAYEAVELVKKRRLPDRFLTLAAEIFRSFSKITQKDAHSFLAAAEAMHAYEAFEIQRTTEQQGLGSAVGPLDAFKVYMTKRFEEASQVLGFTFISAKHKLKDLAAIAGMDNFSEIITKSAGYPLLERSILFMRALACARWGDEKKHHPVQSARNIVRVYIEDDHVRDEMFDNCPFLRKLLFECTLHKVHSSQLDLLVEKERILFLQGPVTTFFKTQKRPIDDPRIEFAIFNLVEEEKARGGAVTPIADLGKKEWGRVAFENWHGRFKQWLAFVPPILF